MSRTAQRPAGRAATREKRSIIDRRSYKAIRSLVLALIVGRAESSETGDRARDSLLRCCLALARDFFRPLSARPSDDRGVVSPGDKDARASRNHRIRVSELRGRRGPNARRRNRSRTNAGARRHSDARHSFGRHRDFATTRPERTGRLPQDSARRDEYCRFTRNVICTLLFLANFHSFDFLQFAPPPPSLTLLLPSLSFSSSSYFLYV